MKKKIALMVTSLVLVVAMAVGGTLAYLTKTTDTLTNTFTVGNIDMTLTEPSWEYDGEGEAAKVYPDAVVAKDPTVTVIKGSEECYVRMLVTISNASVMDTIFAPNGANLKQIFEGYHDNWTYIGNEEDTTNNTRTYEFRYAYNVLPSATADLKLPALFERVHIPADLTETQIAELKDTGFTIDIVAHAIQTAGFESASEAWEAFDEQNN